jgi:hypothetical protein
MGGIYVDVSGTIAMLGFIMLVNLLVVLGFLSLSRRGFWCGRTAGSNN